MTFVPSWTFTVPFGAALVAAAVAVVSQMKRGMPGGRTFGFLMAAVCEWMLCLALQDAAVSGADRDIFRMLSYVGVAAAPPLLVRFAHWYSPRAWKMRAWYVVLLWIVPVLTLGIAATNSFHHLLWGGPPVVLVTAAGEIVVPVPGPWRWVVVAYTSCAAILAEVLVASSRSAGLTPSYARQRVAILVALFLPVIGAALAQLPGVYHPAIDATGLGFVAMGLVFLLGMRPLGIMDIVPVARDAVIEEMCDGLIVLDRGGRIVDINPSAMALLGLPASPIGVAADEVLGTWKQKVARLRAAGDGHVEAAQVHDPDRWCDLRLSSLRDRAGKPYGTLLVIRDLTDRKMVEREREQLIDDLGQAIEDLKTLSGLIPICASCKKIRDDKGYWRQLEEYISTHSEAQFSHAICPECARKLYPGLFDDEDDSST